MHSNIKTLAFLQKQSPKELQELWQETCELETLCDPFTPSWFCAVHYLLALLEVREQHYQKMDKLLSEAKNIIKNED